MRSSFNEPILCTGYSDMVSLDKAQAAGSRASIMKPLTKGELARTVCKALDEQTQDRSFHVAIHARR